MTFLILAFIFYSVAFYFIRKRSHPIAFYSILISFVLPIVLVSISCVKRATSEACVWGQAFLPLYWLASLILAAPIIYFVISFVSHLYKNYTR